MQRSLLFSLLSSLFCLLFLSGCDGGASYDTPGNPRPIETNATRLIGTWRVRSYSSPAGGLHSCPSTTVAFSCDDNDTWTFREDGSMTGLTGDVRPYTYNVATGELTYFGKSAAFSVVIPQVTESLMQMEMDGAPLVEPVALLFERVP